LLPIGNEAGFHGRFTVGFASQDKVNPRKVCQYFSNGLSFGILSNHTSKRGPRTDRDQVAYHVSGAPQRKFCSLASEHRDWGLGGDTSNAAVDEAVQHNIADH
jgi:hypothetical protein